MARCRRARRPAGADPRVHIWGALEARLQSVDLMVLAGLDEGVWPTATRTDPFLSRAMRTEIGLPPPERRIGLAAHDFAAGHGGAARDRRARREARRHADGRIALAATAGGGRRREADDHGDDGTRRPLRGPRARASTVRRRREARSSGQQPRPPLAARPRKPVDHRDRDADPRPLCDLCQACAATCEPLDATRHGAGLCAARHADARGAWPLHQGMDGAVRRRGGGAARCAIGAELFGDDRAISATSMPSGRCASATIARWFVGWEARARRHGRHAPCRDRRRPDIPLAAGGAFTPARPRRPHRRMRDGTLAIYDFKTGTPPDRTQVFAGLTPQMTLEAAMVRAGAFDEISGGRSSVSDLAWLGDRPGRPRRAVSLGGRKGRDRRRPRRRSAGAADRAGRTLRPRRTRAYLSRARPMMRERAISATTIIWRGCANGRWWRARRCRIMAGRGMTARARRIDTATRADDGGRFRSRRLGLGVGQCRLGQDLRAVAARDPAAARRRRPGAHPLPDLHQGGGGRDGQARLRHPRRRGRRSPTPSSRSADRDLEGRPPEPRRLARGRARLFARALETPGGLKIQTIHAFCERLLHQFPFEANVAGHFEVLDERDAKALTDEARRAVLARAAADPDGALGRRSRPC